MEVDPYRVDFFPYIVEEEDDRTRVEKRTLPLLDVELPGRINHLPLDVFSVMLLNEMETINADQGFSLIMKMAKVNKNFLGFIFSNTEIWNALLEKFFNFSFTRISDLKPDFFTPFFVGVANREALERKIQELSIGMPVDVTPPCEGYLLYMYMRLWRKVEDENGKIRYLSSLEAESASFYTRIIVHGSFEKVVCDVIQSKFTGIITLVLEHDKFQRTYAIPGSFDPIETLYKTFSVDSDSMGLDLSIIINGSEIINCRFGTLEFKLHYFRKVNARYPEIAHCRGTLEECIGGISMVGTQFQHLNHYIPRMGGLDPLIIGRDIILINFKQLLFNLMNKDYRVTPIVKIVRDFPDHILFAYIDWFAGRTFKISLVVCHFSIETNEIYISSTLFKDSFHLVRFYNPGNEKISFIPPIFQHQANHFLSYREHYRLIPFLDDGNLQIIMPDLSIIIFRLFMKKKGKELVELKRKYIRLRRNSMRFTFNHDASGLITLSSGDNHLNYEVSKDFIHHGLFMSKADLSSSIGEESQRVVLSLLGLPEYGESIIFTKEPGKPLFAHYIYLKRKDQLCFLGSSARALDHIAI
jgi:hypothetical protein